MSPLTAFALNCTLKPSPQRSSTDRLLDLVADELDRLDVKARSARVVDYDVKPGVTSDEGGGDGWPELRAAVLGAELFQGLNDVGFTLAPGAMTYWVGEAMQKTDFIDLDVVPEKTHSTTTTMVRNAVHLAQLLREAPLPS